MNHCDVGPDGTEKMLTLEDETYRAYVEVQEFYYLL